MLIGTFSSCCFSSENKLGFSIPFCSFVCCVWSFVWFFSFVHSITLKKEEKNLFFPPLLF